MICWMATDLIWSQFWRLASISTKSGSITELHSASKLEAKCIGQKGFFEEIDSFLAERNSLLTSSRWLASWQGDLRNEDSRNWTTFQKVEKVNRVHVVWLLYEVFESIKIEWKHLNDIMKKHEVPLQILILTNPEKDPTGSWKGIFWEIVVPVSRGVHIIWTSSLHHNPITLFEQRDRHGKRLPTAIYGLPPQSIIRGHIFSNTIGSQGSFEKYRGT